MPAYHRRHLLIRARVGGTSERIVASSARSILAIVYVYSVAVVLVAVASWVRAGRRAASVLAVSGELRNTMYQPAPARTKRAPASALRFRCICAASISLTRARLSLPAGSGAGLRAEWAGR